MLVVLFIQITRRDSPNGGNENMSLVLLTFSTMLVTVLRTETFASLSAAG